MRENKIDKLFKQELSSLEVPPPMNVWDGIEGELNAAARKRKVFWLYRVGAAAAIVVVALLTTLFWQGSDNNALLRALMVKPSTSVTADSVQINGNDPLVSDSSVLEMEMKNLTAHQTAPEGDENQDLIKSREEMQRVAQENKTFGDQTRLAARHVTERVSRNLNPMKPKDGEFLAVAEVMAPDLIDHSANKNEIVNFEGLIKSGEREAELARAFRLKVKVGGEYSPTYAFREVSGVEGPARGASYSEDGMMTSSGGLKVSVQMHPRWSVETGVRYAMLGQEVTASFNESRLYMESVEEKNLSLRNIGLGNSMGNISNDQRPVMTAFKAPVSDVFQNEVVDLSANNRSETEANIEQMLGYVEVPLTLRYKVFEQGMSVSVCGGVSTNWLVENDAVLYGADQKQDLGKTEGLSNLSFSTHAGVAVSLPVYGSFTFQLEPRVSYFLSDINGDYPTSFKPYSFGVFTGIFYSFGK